MRPLLAIVFVLAACHRPMNRDPDGAVARCRAAVETVGSAAVERRSAVLAAGCADVYSAPRCHAAFLHAGDVAPAERAASIARACRDDYCPLLSSPKPALCAGDLPPPSQLLAEWRELQPRIVERELGADRAQLLARAQPITVALPASPAPVEAAPECTVTVDPRAVRVAAPGRSPIVVPIRDGKLDERALRAAFQSMPRSSGRLAITAAPSVPYATVIGIMDAARDRFSKVALSTVSP